MYALKSDSYSIFYYLLYLGADINDFDYNKSSLAHWGAYNNNVFLLKLLKKIGSDLNVVDDS